MKSYFVVTGIVTYKDKMLILKKSQSDRNFPNHWSFCSGFVKEFEAAEDAVLREIKEETRLEGKIEKKGRIIETQGNDKIWIVMPFLYKAESDEVILDHENTEYAWITKEEIKNYQFVPGVIKDLKSVGFL